MTSILEIVNGVFLQSLQKEDEKFLAKTEQDFEDRRVMLVIQLRESNAAMILDYQQEFNRKIDEVLVFREAVIRKEEESFQLMCERAVEEQRTILNKICSDQLTWLGTLCGRTMTDIAEIALSLQSVMKEQLTIYERDIEKSNALILSKLKKSALNRAEMQDWLKKEVQEFKECDDIHVAKFSDCIYRSNHIFLRLIEDTDIKFRSHIAAELQTMQGIVCNEEHLVSLIEEHKKERSELVKARFDPQDDEFILHNDLVNRKVIDRLHSECPGCFGHGHISHEYYKICGVQHEDRSCCEAGNSDQED